MHEFEQIKLKYIAEIFNGNSIPDELKNNYVGKSIPYIPTKELSVEDGAINYDNGLSVSETDGFRIAPSESVLMCIEGGSAGKKIGFTDRPVAFVNKLCCIHGKTAFPKILYHALRSKDFTDQFFLNMTGLIGGVTVSVLKNLTITIPKSISEQQAIADILDRKCTQIDALIANEEQQIAKLKAYKQSVITETVTKGLDPDVPMKDSGVEWIGEIPEHWEVIPLKHLVSYNDETLGDNTEENFEFDYIDIGSVEYGKGITHLQPMKFKDSPSRARRIVRKDDIILSTVRTYLKAVARICFSQNQQIASTGFIVLRAKTTKIRPDFLSYAVLSNAFISIVEASSVGISYPAINACNVVAIKIPIPSLAEQQQIADYLDQKCEQIDRLIAIKQQKIEKIQQYKKSVIYEYVTGKREVST